MFTGTLIEDLIATVERAEQASSNTMLLADSIVADSMVADSLVANSLLADSWFASVQERMDCDSKLLGVA